MKTFGVVRVYELLGWFGTSFGVRPALAYPDPPSANQQYNPISPLKLPLIWGNLITLAPISSSISFPCVSSGKGLADVSHAAAVAAFAAAACAGARRSSARQLKGSGIV